MNNFPSKDTVERLRKQYPSGTRVELVHMNDPYSKLRPGDQVGGGSSEKRTSHYLLAFQ